MQANTTNTQYSVGILKSSIIKRSVSIVIAIETSVPEASITLSIGGEIIATEEFESHRQQNKLLFPSLDAVLAHLREKDLAPTQIIVGTGPGSYSGSRISIAAAQGLAIAYGCPVASLGSFQATATFQQSENGYILAIGDARRESYFIADIKAGSAVFSPQLMDCDTFLQRLSEIDPAIPRVSFEHELPTNNFLRDLPHATGLISAWEQLSQAEQDRLNTTPPQPLYLRAPFISKAKPGHPLLRKSKK